MATWCHWESHQQLLQQVIICCDKLSTCFGSKVDPHPLFLSLQSYMSANFDNVFFLYGFKTQQKQKLVLSAAKNVTSSVMFITHAGI